MRGHELGIDKLRPVDISSSINSYRARLSRKVNWDQIRMVGLLWVRKCKILSTFFPRKMHRVCIILEYFPLKPGSLKILPPPPPPKAMLKCGRNLFAFRINNIDQAGVGVGVTMVANSPSGSPASKLNTFLSKIVASWEPFPQQCFSSFVHSRYHLHVMILITFLNF